LNVYHTIQIIQNRQEWLTQYLDDLDFPDLDFVGRFDENSNYKTIVNDIRGFLQLEPEWAAELKNWADALNYLTGKIEDTGIIVTFNGVVGTNNYRPIEVRECRGFVLVNNRAPFMFINAADAKAAQIFTLIHELAHVWLGKSAGFDNQNLIPANDPIEILCDRVAAELLVPEDSFHEKWRITQDYTVLGKIFKVSPIVITRRALDLGFISLKHFFDFYNDYMAGFEREKARQSQKSGGDFYATARKRVSVRFAAFVNSAVKENKLLYRDAYKLTNLKGNTYNTFVT
jgi:Zn-dependent peptidase ImmA (M78 family)